jgi:general secretion pathway protein L
VKASLPVAAREVWRWWIAELNGMIPDALRPSRIRNERRLVLSVEGQRFRPLAERRNQCEALAPDAGAEKALAASLELLVGEVQARPGTPAGIRLTSEDCFTRLLQLPAPAERDFGSILDLDLERSTPFRHADVLTAHYVDPAAPAEPGKRAVRHLIVKRSRIEPLARQMAELGIAPSFADCWDETRGAALPVNFLAARSLRAAGPAARLIPTLAAATVLLVISALAIFIVRHENALAELDAQIAETRASAQTVRHALDTAREAAARIDALERLARERTSALRVVDELTTILPDSAWVYDFRLDAGAIEATGFARSAAALIALFERSPTFTEAALTAPVVFDGGEDRERFSLRAHVRGAAPGAPQASADQTAEVQ